jgi:hypothetical protein
MKRITTSFDDDTYEILRKHAFKLRVSVSKHISQLAANSTVQEISSKPKDHPVEEKPWKQIIQCDTPFCRNEALGEFRIDTNSTDTGDLTQNRFMCNYHKNLAKKEGTVTQI